MSIRDDDDPVILFVNTKNDREIVAQERGDNVAQSLPSLTGREVLRKFRRILDDSLRMISIAEATGSRTQLAH